jgi:hypothetical protein
LEGRREQWKMMRSLGRSTQSKASCSVGSKTKL